MYVYMCMCVCVYLQHMWQIYKYIYKVFEYMCTYRGFMSVNKKKKLFSGL